MRRRVRPLPLLLALLAGLALVLGLRLALVVASLHPDAMAAQLRDEARARTGHDLTVEGLEISLLPPAVTLTGVTLGPAPGFGPEPLAQVERLHATLRLLPLLRREVALGEVSVGGLRVELVRGTTGRGSWETLREHLGGLRGEGQEGLPELPGLRVRDARLRYRDLATGRAVEVDGLSLRVGRGFMLQPQAVAVEGALRSAEPAAEGNFTATGHLLAPPGALIHVQDLTFDADFTAEGRSAGLRGVGALEFDTARAYLTARSLALHLEAAGADLPVSPLAADLTGQLRSDLRSGRIWLEDLSLDALGLQATGTLAAEGLPEAPELSGSLAISHQDLGAALGRLRHPLALADPSLLHTVTATLPFRWTDGALHLDDLDLRLGNGRVTGDLTARGIRPPDLRFELDATDLDLDGLRPTPEQGGLTWPPAGLAKASLAGRLRGHDLRLRGVALEDLDLPLSLERGRLQLSKASVVTLGGGLGLDLEADLAGDGPHRVAGEVVTLDLARLLRALGSERGLTGTAEVQGSLWARGQGTAAMKESLSGNLCFTLTDGIIPLQRGGEDALKGHGQRPERAGRATQRLSGVTERVVARARERVGGQVPSQLTYHRLSACFELEDGVASTSDLRLDATELDLEGAGQIDLTAGTLDLSCLLTMGEFIPIGMRIQGSLDDPQVEVDKPERMELVRGLMERRREERRVRFQEERQAVRDELREAGGETADLLLDQREKALERRDEVKDQVRETVQEVRDAAHERRGKVREKIKEALSRDEEESEEEAPAEGEEEGAQQGPAPG